MTSAWESGRYSVVTAAILLRCAVPAAMRFVNPSAILALRPIHSRRLRYGSASKRAIGILPSTYHKLPESNEHVNSPRPLPPAVLRPSRTKALDVTDDPTRTSKAALL